MKERISEFLKRENKSSALFAEEIGVQPSGISHILSGRNRPSLDFVLKMLETYPYININWLLFGKGNMYNPEIIPDLFGNYTDISVKKESEKEVSHENEAEGSIKAATEAAGHGPVVYDQSLAEKPSVRRIVLLYDDNSFEEYLSKKPS